MIPAHTHRLKIKNLGIDSYRENIIFMRSDCPVCVSEGFKALTRIMVHKDGKEIIATLNVVHSQILAEGEAGLSIEALHRLNASDGDIIYVSHLAPIASLGKVRAKMYGKELDEMSYREIINDIVAGHYSNLEIAAFVASCAGEHLSVNETISLTKAMIAAGNKITWSHPMILDKHSVGGLPGNRTTPIIVSIVAAAGLKIPKTSSRAITSPAGTADTMEVFTSVNLTLEKLKEVVNEVGGCLAWGGAVKLSPADDLLIGVEKALEIDSEGQMVASVLSKKAAAGSTHVVIDIPVGPTAKVRSQDEALKLQYFFKAVGEAIGLCVDIFISDGLQPVGRGIGPCLEAMDVLSVLRNETGAPTDLKERAVKLASLVLNISGKYSPGTEYDIAKNFLENGDAYKKFIAICNAQGGFKEPSFANYTFNVLAENEGYVKNIDNRKLARIAKLAGAPQSPSAGVLFLAPLGKMIKSGDVLFTIYSESVGELEYAREYYLTVKDIILID